MKIIRNLIVWLGMFVLSVVFNATLTAQPVDSIVQITAEVQGLEQVSPDEWTPFATYWEAMPGAATFAPLPGPMFNATFPVYAIADGIYLVDGTGGQLPPGDSVTAMEMESNAVVNLINQVEGAQMAQAMGGMRMDLTGPPGFGGGGGYSYTNSGYTYTYNTNLLWLQITNVSVSLETAYVNLYNATDQVYAIWSTTNLLIPFSLWQVETEVFPTNGTTNRLAFTVPTLGRQDLFLRAQDWTGVFANGLPDWWMWYYFHTLDLSWTNEDASDKTLGHDYTNHIDPDTIAFIIAVTNTEVNTAYPILPLNVSSGVPGCVAVLVNDTNLADAVWLPYTSSNVVATLGADGDYAVSIGLRGFPTNATETWQTVPLIKDTIAPVLTVTGPVGGSISQTPVQFQGFANKALNTLTFDLSNASGTFTNQQGYLTGVFYDTNLLAYTTNYFQSDDVDLASGPNIITLYATDWAGNETNVSFTVNYVPSTNPPVLTVIWPPAGTAISGSNFTLQAQVDQPTATISATAGATTVQGLIERNGTAWVQNLPLTPGTNSITVTVSDSNGSTSTNFSVVDNDVGLVIDPLTSDQLNQPSVSVYGEIGDTNLCVYANGVKATVNEDGTWEADNVPVSPMGTAIVSVQVYIGDPILVASQILYQAQPVTVAMMSYWGRHEPDVSVSSETINWSYLKGGNYDSSQYGNCEISSNENGVAYINYGGIVVPFSMPWESASVTTPLFWVDEPFWYGNYTQTRVMVEPSGQTPAGTTNLYLVFANASEFSTYQMEYGLLESTYGWEYGELLTDIGSYPDLVGYAGDVPLPPDWLQIRGQTLLNSGITNSDGSVSGFTLVSAPAGKNWDVTPVATNVYQNWAYTFNAQAYQVNMQIINANTGTNLSAQTNTVIVGQQMNLTCQLSITNSFMTNFVLTNFQWTVPGYAISNYVVAADSSSAMVVTNFATNNQSTVFYWVDGASNRMVQCSATVNGQTVTGQAVFNVYRPSITNFTDEPPSYPTNCLDGGTLYLQLGDGNAHGDMMYQVNVLSKYKGRAGIIQLINRNASNGSFGSGSLGTGGQFWLDTSIPYIASPVNTNGLTPVNFSDNPGVADVASLLSATTTCTDAFVDYIVFRPDAGNPNSNIYIPLGVVSGGSPSWAWTASTYWLAGWSIPVGSVTRPTAPNNNGPFPTWLHLYQNAQ
jgi:hypothetical protein